MRKIAKYFEIIKPFIMQTIVMTEGNLKARYRKTFAGMLWVILNPIIMYGVQSLVFKKFLGLQIPNFYLFLASGLLPWIFLVQSIQMCTPLLFCSRDILLTYHVHPLVMLMAQILDNLINFLLAFIILIIPLYLGHHQCSIGVLFIPISLFFLVWGIFVLTWLLSTLNVFFRDTKFILDFVTSIAFWITPIFYPIQYIPAQFRWIIELNPAYYFIRMFRASMIDFSLNEYLSTLPPVIILNLIFTGLAYLYWKKNKNTFYLSL